MTLHLFVPDCVKEAEKPCELRCVSSHLNIVDYSCKKCDYHPSCDQYAEPDCKEGRLP